MEMGDMMKLAVGIGVFFILLGTLVIPNFQTTQDYVTQDYEDVDSSSEWTDAIDSSNSNNYEVVNGILNITSDASTVTTNAVDTENHSRLVLNSEHIQGDVDVKLISNETDSTLVTKSASGDTNLTLEASDYTEDAYYIEFTTTSTTDAEIDAYDVEGQDDVSDDVSILIYVVLLLFLVGIGLGVWARAKGN